MNFPFNYDDMSSNKMFKSIVKLFGFKQLVWKSTRITEASSKLFDLIFINAPQNIRAVQVVSNSLSDHEMVTCVRKINHQVYKPRSIKCIDYKNYDPNKLTGTSPMLIGNFCIK